VAESRLMERVDAWTLQVVAASRFLLGLYRKLRDDKQAYRAVAAGAPSAERMQRLGISSHLHEWDQKIKDSGLEEIEQEELAWRFMVEGLGGVCAFHAMSDMADGRPASGLQKSRRDNLKAFHWAIQGYRTSFPFEMAEGGIHAAIESMATASVDTLAGDLFGSDKPENESFRRELHGLVFDALLAETA
jgi:hypothetical protein